jgi:hypothetical protein
VSAAPSLLASADDDTPRTTVEVVRRWAAAVGLRGGLTRCFYPSALVPLVERWAYEQGWGPPDARAVGMGLAAVGISLFHAGGRGRRLLLHRDDAARLRKLVWEAWAPRVPPGERPRTKPGRQPLQAALARLAYLESKPPTPTFHAQLARDGGLSRVTPVVDNRGRVYPSVAYAARALSAKRDKPKAPALLERSLWKGGMWKGRLWRRLLPEELPLVPHDALCGALVKALSWQQVCQSHRLMTQAQLGHSPNQCSFGAAARDDDREG